MARRPYGEGSITPAGPGHWKIQISLGVDADGRRRRTTRTISGTKRDAQQWLARERARLGLRTGAAPAAHLATVAQLHAQWWPHAAPARGSRQAIAATTRARWAPAIRDHLLPELGHLRVIDVTGPVIRQWHRRLIRAGVSPHLVKSCHQALSSMMREAVDLEWITSNPTLGNQPPRPPAADVSAPTEAEILRLHAAFDELAARRGGRLWATWFRLAAYTGARRGEVAGLTWADVDLDERVLHIRRGVTYTAAGGVVVGDLKTEASARHVPLSADAVDLLRSWRASRRETALAAGRPIGAEAYVFGLGVDGADPPRPGSATQEFGRLARRIGAPHLTLHSLRHAAATHMIAAGIDPATVAALLGHDVGMTLRTYTMVLDRRRRDAVDALGAAWTRPVAGRSS